MWKDPVVTEVRKAGEKLAKKAKNNLRTYFKNLRKAETKYQVQIAEKGPTYKFISRKATKCLSVKNTETN